MYRKFFKRFFDVMLSGCALILLSPVLLIVADKAGQSGDFLPGAPGEE